MAPKKSKDIPSEANCWECIYNNLAGDSFLGVCTWFSKHQKGPNKEIPPKVIDKGCQHFTSLKFLLSSNQYLKIASGMDVYFWLGLNIQVRFKLKRQKNWVRI